LARLLSIGIFTHVFSFMDEAKSLNTDALERLLMLNKQTMDKTIALLYIFLSLA
jgi:type II secretory pathway predicted ATPase ExeA